MIYHCKHDLGTRDAVGGIHIIIEDIHKIEDDHIWKNADIYLCKRKVSTVQLLFEFSLLQLLSPPLKTLQRA